MSAPNAQPAKRGGMKAPETHAPSESGQPSATLDGTTKVTPGVAPHGTPGKVGGRKGNGSLH